MGGEKPTPLPINRPCVHGRPGEQFRTKQEEAEQKNLVITPQGEPEITADNIEVAQFVYLLLHNEKLHGIIDTITSKVVLILGRFTPERKAVLDATDAKAVYQGGVAGDYA